MASLFNGKYIQCGNRFLPIKEAFLEPSLDGEPHQKCIFFVWKCVVICFDFTGENALDGWVSPCCRGRSLSDPSGKV